MILPVLVYGDHQRFFLHVAGVASWAHAAGQPSWRDVVDDLVAFLVAMDAAEVPPVRRSYN